MYCVFIFLLFTIETTQFGFGFNPNTSLASISVLDIDSSSLLEDFLCSAFLFTLCCQGLEECYSISCLRMTWGAHLKCIHLSPFTGISQYVHSLVF